MIWFLVKRLAAALPTIVISASIVFFVARILPGDPAQAILGDSASEAALVALRHRLGLDQPLATQFLSFLQGLVRLDLGQSMISGRPIVSEVLEVLPYTLELTAFAIAFGLALGVPMGVVAAMHRNAVPDYVTRVASLIGLSSPPFFLGICLLLLFAIILPWFPVISAPQKAGLIERLRVLILPGATLGIIFMAFVARAMRASMLEILPEQFIRTARSKGISETAVTIRHACRNALLPIVNVSGLYFGILMGNSVVTEIVFTRPGLGKLIVGALGSRDYVMLQGLTIAYCAVVIVVSVLTDIVQALVDPRVQLR